MLVEIALVLVAYRLAHRLSGHRPTAVIAAILFAVTERGSLPAAQARDLVWFPLVALTGVMLAVEAYATRSLVLGAAAGLLTAGTVAFEPAAVVLAPALAAGWLLGRSSGAPDPGPMLAFFAFAAGAGAGLLAIGTLADLFAIPSAPFAESIARHVAERAAIIGLDRRTWIAALLEPLPLIGDLVGVLLPPQELVRIGPADAEGSIAREGGRKLLAAALAQTAPGNYPAAAAAIIRDEMMGHISGFISSLPVVTVRGLLGGGGLLALIGMLQVPRMIRYARVDGSIGRVSLIAAAALVMLLTNVLFTVNDPWLNPLLPFLFVYAIAAVTGGW